MIFFCHFFSMKYPAPSGTCLEVLLSKHRLVKLLKSEPVTLSVQGRGNHLCFSLDGEPMAPPLQCSQENTAMTAGRYV